jgi:hypothetical protein
MVSEKTLNHINTWKTQNPDIVHKLWTDAEIEILMKEKYPDIYEYFRLLARPVMKSDIFRLVAVHEFGGIWADLDTENYSPLKDIPGTNVHVIVGVEADKPNVWYQQGFARSLQFTQYVFASTPKHPLIKQMLDSILVDLKSMPVTNGKIDVVDNLAVLDFAGPGMFTDNIFSYLKDKGYGWWRQWRNLRQEGQQIEDVLLLPQVRWGNNMQVYEEGNWVLHLFAGSWK